MANQPVPMDDDFAVNDVDQSKNSYVIAGLNSQESLFMDAIFAYSLGKCDESYELIMKCLAEKDFMPSLYFLKMLYFNKPKTLKPDTNRYQFVMNLNSRIQNCGQSAYDAIKFLEERIYVSSLMPIVYCILGLCYLRGVVDKADQTKGLNLLERSCLRNCAFAQYHLASLCKTQPHPTPYTIEQVNRWTVLAANCGHAGAQYLLSCLYYHGFARDIDYVESLRWLEMSSEQEFCNAQCALGRWYYDGPGADQTTKRDLIIDCYKRAANQGLPQAAYNLATLYCFESNWITAVFYYTEAAGMGHIKACYALGIAFYYGRGVDKDLDKAAQYFAVASAGGLCAANSYLKKIKERPRASESNEITELQCDADATEIMDHDPQA